MTVQEFFESEKIFKDDIVNVSDESDYWEKASGFVLEKWSDDINNMSPKQAAWLDRIQEDLIEKRIRSRR